MKIPEHEFHAEVTFHVRLKDVDDIAVMVKAAEIDDEVMGNGPEEVPNGYTFSQAFQLIWHHEPEWAFKHLLIGWTLDKSDAEDGTMQPIWKGHGE